MSPEANRGKSPLLPPASVSGQAISENPLDLKPLVLSGASPESLVNAVTPIKLVVPYIRASPGKKETIKDVVLNFYPERIRRLLSMKLVILVGGSPNSGKSTLSASLWLAIQAKIQECEQCGILTPGQLMTDICDLDLVSPTSGFIVKGEAPPIRPVKTEWTPELAVKAVEQLEEKTSTNHLLVVDLPGGTPDHITASIFGASKQINLSIMVDNFSRVSAKHWRNFLLDSSQTQYLVAVHSRLKESGHHSGIRRWNSYSRGDSRNFLVGQIADLSRKPNPNDPLIQFIANWLLFDYLPNTDKSTNPTQTGKPANQYGFLRNR